MSSEQSSGRRSIRQRISSSEIVMLNSGHSTAPTINSTVDGQNYRIVVLHYNEFGGLIGGDVLTGSEFNQEEFEERLSEDGGVPVTCKQTMRHVNEILKHKGIK